MFLYLYLLGISAFTQSISARQRWTANLHIRTTLASHLCNYLGLNKGEDISREAYSSRVKKDNTALQSIQQFIISCTNPFKDDSDSPLVKISSGKVAFEGND